MSDLDCMHAALALARRGLGNVWPNPAVGCVIVKEGRVLGRGWTQPGGRPHAEAEALARAGSAARGATAYVTLEPCCHEGRGPPCAQSLIAAGVTRVVAAIEDPYPGIAGEGFRLLREAGIAVEVGLGAAEADEINAGFLMRVRTGRPLVTLKLAASLDGRIATASGESRWITGPAARERAHALRASHDAILVGTGTVLADDPELTCRLPGLGGHSPLRVVFDRHLRLPPAAKVFPPPCWVLTLAADAPALRARGAEIITVPDDLAATLQILGTRGLTRVLAEGGGRLAASLLKAGLVDRLVWMHAPMTIGGDGIPAIDRLGLRELAAAPRFALTSSERAGDDVIETYRVTA